MKLNSIELTGFKSFANKTKIDFKDGLTEIVGPNGSGKSNLIEAIRWVLGEHKIKSLRSSKMTDVIFSGSDDKKALNRAKVTVTFDNSDHFFDSAFTEIKITRKIYRTGENEYSINDRICRLKDIDELLVNTGLGSFSIISQGEVDKVFDNSKDNNHRHEIIETVAGVYKYRQRKLQTKKDLLEMNNNLNKISYISNEVSKQLAPLKLQSEKAEVYLKKQDALKNIKKENLILNLYNIQAHQNITIQTLKNLKNSLKEYYVQINKDKDDKNDLKNDIETLQYNNKRFQDQFIKLNRYLDSYTNEVKLQKQKLFFQNNKLSELKISLNKINKNLNNFDVEVKDLKNKVLELENIKKSYTEKLNEIKLNENNKLVTNIENEIEQLRIDNLVLKNKQNKILNEINYLNKLKQENIEFFNENIKEIHKLKTFINSQNDIIKEKKVILMKFKKELKSDKQLLEILSSKVFSLKEKISLSQKDWEKITKKMQKTKVEYDTTINSINLKSSSGTRSILNNQKNISGIIGKVIDYLRVPNKYSIAIETVLGRQLEEIIVKKAFDAKKAIEFLNEGNLGRVTFLPLDDLKKRSIDYKVKKLLQEITGFVGVGSDLVAMPLKLKVIVDYLLGNLIVAKDLKSALLIGKKITHRYRIVTLKGEIVHAGGAVSGGNFNAKFPSTFEQKEKLSKIKKQLTNYKFDLKNIEKLLSNYRFDLNKIRDKKLQTEENLREVITNTNNIKINILENNSLVTEKKQKLKSLHSGKYKENIYYDKLVKLNKNLDITNKFLKRNDQQLLDNKSILNKSKKNDIKIIESKYEIKQNILLTNENIKHLNKEIIDKSSFILKNNQEKNDITNRLDKINLEIKNVKTNLDLYKNDKEIELKRNKQFLIEKIKSNEKELILKQKIIEKIDNKIIKNQRYFLKQESFINQNENKYNQNEQFLKEYRKDLKEKYDYEYKKDKINLTNKDIAINDKFIKKNNIKIKKLTRDIQHLGAVNLNALHDYNEVKSRFNFIKEQKSDLENSQIQLIKMMNSIDKVVKNKFYNTFVKLNNSFSQTFKKIFGGGKAKLNLTDPKHVLTSDVEIVVQPPGKNYRNINLLSGGEKALTALSFLFAILEIKSVPLVILDEAEAALDPANVNRFSRYINSLKQKNQFILITHRKETMTYADNLYGVTMQNSGISKLVSVTLSSFKNHFIGN